MSKTHSHRTAPSWLTITVAFCVSCATSPRSETTNSATPPPTPAARDQSKTTESAPAQLHPEDEAQASPRAQSPAPASEPAFATPPPESKAQKQPTPRERYSAPARAASKPTAAGERSASGNAMLQDALRPVSSDPPQLRSALEELLSAASELSTGHSCDHGCKAYESMQRAALRICELAPSNDPLSRCTSARSRVSEADLELKRRCGTCSK
jgi:hypothetical protein